MISLLKSLFACQRSISCSICSICSIGSVFEYCCFFFLIQLYLLYRLAPARSIYANSLLPNTQIFTVMSPWNCVLRYVLLAVYLGPGLMITHRNGTCCLDLDFILPPSGWTPLVSPGFHRVWWTWSRYQFFLQEWLVILRHRNQDFCWADFSIFPHNLLSSDYYSCYMS